ncbi:hypothetical protein [Roseateles sp. P5_D6]
MIQMDLGPSIVHRRLISRRAAMLGLGATLAAPSIAGQLLEVVYPRTHERPTDGTPFKLLTAALEASGRPHTLRVSEAPLPSMRAFLELKGGGVNVMDTGASPKVAERTLILPFPLDLGLSGYRLMLVRRDRLDRLRAVREHDDLRQLVFGQGPDWVDSSILRAAGLKVQEAEFLHLFRMLEAGRFDAFPLGADEAGMLLDMFGHLAPSVVLFEDWCVHYRFARVFAVRRDEPALADALNEGLSRLFVTGRAREILARDARIGPLLDGRRRLPASVFELDNPLWTAPFRAIPEALFFKPH